MATLVTFHAHPDDEAIACGGTMARAAAEGHRVVLVVATRGEHGEVEDGVLAAGETLAEHRVRETDEAAQILDDKRRAMAAHASQIGPESFFLNMTPEVFALTWGKEWYIRRRAPQGTVEDWLLE